MQRENQLSFLLQVITKKEDCKREPQNVRTEGDYSGNLYHLTDEETEAQKTEAMGLRLYG